jgi:hypothetical protein
MTSRVLYPLILTFLAAAVPAQQASVTPYGQGCVLNGQQLALQSRGLPRLGTTFTLVYSGPNFTFSSAQQRAQPWLLLGLQQLAIPVPPVLPQQPPGCFVYTTPDASVPMPPDPTGVARFVDAFDLAVPNSPNLLGALFFAQWLCVFEQCGFAGCGIAGAPTSDGARITIGM